MDIIVGRNPVIEALRAGRRINRILIENNVEKHGSIGQILQLAKNSHIEVEYTDRHSLARYSSTGSDQGVIAFAEAKGYLHLGDLLEVSSKKGEAPFYLVLDGIEDPHNLGAILRTADATGVHGVIIRERRAVGITPTVIKASAGAVEYVPVAHVNNISQAIITLKKNNIWVIGVDMNGKVDYTAVDFRLPTSIVIGSEGKGLTDLVVKRCDMIVSIPMKGKISSLNASVAAALVMYEAFQQRRRATI